MSGTNTPGVPGEGATVQPGTEGTVAPKTEPVVAGAGTTPVKPAVTEVKTPKRVAAGDQGDIPEDADLVELSPAALKSRLNRHTKSELKKRFGSDDVETIKKDLEELQLLRKEKEDKRTADLSEIEREKEARVKAERERDTAVLKVRSERQSRDFEKYENRLERVGEALLDEDYVDREITRFAKHLTATFDKKELDKWDAKRTAEEFKTFLDGRLKEKPKMAKNYDDTRRKEIEEELKAEARGERKRQKVTNGAVVDKTPDAGNGGGDSKTMKPGKQNTMSGPELRAHLKKQGINYPG